MLNIELSNPSEHFEELIKFFFLFHDPTTLNRQGNDVGTQYASAIFVKSDEQKTVAGNIMNELQLFLDGTRSTPYSGKTLSTKIYDYTTFVSQIYRHKDFSNVVSKQILYRFLTV